MLEQRPEYTRLTDSQSSDNRSLRDLEAEIGDHAELLALDEEELNQRLDAATAKRAKLSDVDQEIGAIEQRVKDATQGSDAEQALADVESKRDALLEAGEKAQLIVLSVGVAARACFHRPAVLPGNPDGPC